MGYKPTDGTSGVEEFWDPLRSGRTMLLLWSWNCPSIPGEAASSSCGITSPTHFPFPRFPTCQDPWD